MGYRVVVTDLDGTLLDHGTYSWDCARPALDRLHAENIPCIFATSKTRAEVEHLRREMGNTHPFIVENGGALVVPQDYFPAALPNGTVRGGAITIEWGTAYAILVEALRRAAERTGYKVRGFSEMSVAEVARVCNLSQEQARLAKMREYDEPFVVLARTRAGSLRAAIEAQGFCWTSGGRLHHITGENDKGRAVRTLMELYRQAYGDVVSIGLGDSLNDMPLLENVTFPVVMPSRHAAEVRRQVPRAALADRHGPEGWNRAVLSLVSTQPLP